MIHYLNKNPTFECDDVEGSRVLVDMNLRRRRTYVAPGQKWRVIPAADHRDAAISGRDENPRFSGSQEDELDVGVVVYGNDVIGDGAEVSGGESVAGEVGIWEVKSEVGVAAVGGSKERNNNYWGRCRV